MNRIKTRLNSVGLALLFAGLAAWRIWPHRRAVPLVLAGLGLAAVAAYVVLNLASLKKGFTRKSFLYSGNLLLVVAGPALEIAKRHAELNGLDASSGRKCGR